jgi:hypothetical protein
VNAVEDVAVARKLGGRNRPRKCEREHQIALGGVPREDVRDVRRVACVRRILVERGGRIEVVGGLSTDRDGTSDDQAHQGAASFEISKHRESSWRRSGARNRWARFEGATRL